MPVRFPPQSAYPPFPPPALDRALKTSDRIAAAIIEDIVTNGLQPGDRLPNEAAMVERFRVARGSLREALRILEVHGLISQRTGPGGGPFVIAVHPRNVARTFSLYLHLAGATIRELLEARLFVEPMIARQAALTGGPVELQRLRDAVEYEASIPARDGRYLHAANNFHYALATMSGNRVIDLVATALKELSTSRVVEGGLIGLSQDDLRHEHAAIAEAIFRGDAATAERLTGEHTQFYLGLVAAVPGLAQQTISWG